MKRSSKVINVVLLALWCFSLLTNISKAISPEELRKIEDAAPAKATAVPKQPRRMLLFDLCNGYKHSSIPYWNEALVIMGHKTGAYNVVISNDMSIFRPENLESFDAICLNNTTKLDFEDPNLRKGLMDFIEGGKGIVGIHAATDNFYDWPKAAEMMGGQFCGHPWGAGGTWAVKLDDPNHPLTAAFAGKGFKIKDEIYRTSPPLYSRTRQRILLSLDMTDEATHNVKGLKPSDMDTGISWVKSYGEGRLFYCSLGHNHHITWNPAVLRHYLDGIQFALGDLPVGTVGITPSAQKRLDDLLPKIVTYNYGRSRKPLTKLSNIVRNAYDSPEELKLIETYLLKLLQSNVTPACKQFICRKLSIIGTEEAVPTLAKMLTDPKTSDMARYALERIPGSAVDKALRDALGKTRGRVKVGIINSLGERGDKQAVWQISKLLGDTDKEIAFAAISAMGKIGSSRAIMMLERARSKVAAELHPVWADAYLICADKFLAKGNLRRALQIYKRMYVPAEPVPIRIAALRGIATATPKRAAKVIVDVIRSDDRQMQTMVIGLLKEVAGTEVIKAVTAELPNLPASGQIQLLSALADRGDRSVLPTVVDATKSPKLDVRIAAFAALGELGNASTVDLLAQTGVATLLKTAQDPEEKVRLESFKVLRVIAGQEHLPALVGLLINVQSEPERKEAEKCVAAVARKVGDESRRAEAILAVLPSVKDVKSRCSLLSVLGRLGDDSALPMLRKALKDKDANVRAAAIRALAGWHSPNAKLIDDLREIARSSDNELHRVLALRGFVHLIGLDSARPAEEKIRMYQEAMRLAPNMNEKKMVLSGLTSVRTFVALQMAAGYLRNKDLQPEAEVAVVKIAEGASGSHPQQTKGVLQKIIKTSKNDSLCRQARKLIEQIKQFEDYITTWQVSDPYTKQGLGPQKLFDAVFEPEINPENINWRTMPSATDRNKPWLLELDKAIGGSNRAAYLRTNLRSPKTQKARLELGSDDGIKVWLNGELVHSSNVTRGISPGQDAVELTLHKGWNKLMMKVTQGQGQWAVCARLRSLDGDSLPGLKVVADLTSKLQAKIKLIGNDFSAWRKHGDWQIVGEATMNPENQKSIATKPGSGIIVNGAKGRTVNLLSRAEFADVRVHIEFMVPRKSNSGVYFMGRYEIQVLDSWGVKQPNFDDCGGIYQRWDENRTPKGYQGRPPRVNASLPPGQWQSYDCIFHAPRFDKSGKKIANARFEKVIHNGIMVHENAELTGPTRASAYRDEKPTGPLMLQGDHGPVAYRNIWIVPLKAEMKILKK